MPESVGGACRAGIVSRFGRGRERTMNAVTVGLAGIRLKRVYDRALPEDGFRILVDRLWPRGMTRGQARIDLWTTEFAPSNELRRWFNHEAQKWEGFEQRYREELSEHRSGLRDLARQIRNYGTVTLLFGARDTEHNQAVVLKKVLEEIIAES